MKLKTIYDNAEDIPEGYADLYTERNGKWELTGIEGVKTQADVERVQEALRKEKNDHKTTKGKLEVFDGLDADEIAAQATKLEEVTAQLEAINKDGTIDEAKIEPIIAARLKQATAPLDRQITNLEKQVDAQKRLVGEREGEVVSLKGSITMDSIVRTVRDAAIVEKVQTSALEDVVLRASVFEKTDDGKIITKDVPGTTPGLTPKEWLKDMQEKAPHWWPASVGGGSGRNGGGGGPGANNNPWSKEHWNMTKQGALVRELGTAKAAELAARVGCKIGDTKPAA